MSNFFFGEHQIFLNNDDLDAFINPASLGSDLVTNGGFDSGSSGWSFGSGWSLNFSPTEARATSSLSGAELGQTQFITSGDYYYLQFTIRTVAGNNWTIIPRCAGYTHKAISGTVPQEGAKTYNIIFQAVNSGGFMTPNWLNFLAYTDSSTTVAIDSISLKHVDTTDLFRGQWANGEPWPIKGSFQNYTADQSIWWVGE